MSLELLLWRKRKKFVDRNNSLNEDQIGQQEEEIEAGRDGF